MNNFSGGSKKGPNGELYVMNGSKGYCYLCSVELTSPQHCRQHIEGSKHKKKERDSAGLSSFFAPRNDHTTNSPLRNEHTETHPERNENTASPVQRIPSLPNSREENNFRANSYRGPNGEVCDKIGPGGYCYACAVSFTSIPHAKDHLAGQKHKKKVAQTVGVSNTSPSLLGDGNSQQTAAGYTGLFASTNVQGFSPAQNKNDNTSVFIPGVSVIMCSICNVPFSGLINADQHFNSHRHKIRVDTLNPSRLTVSDSTQDVPDPDLTVSDSTQDTYDPEQTFVMKVYPPDDQKLAVSSTQLYSSSVDPEHTAVEKSYLTQDKTLFVNNSQSDTSSTDHHKTINEDCLGQKGATNSNATLLHRPPTETSSSSSSPTHSNVLDRQTECSDPPASVKSHEDNMQVLTSNSLSNYLTEGFGSDLTLSTNIQPLTGITSTLGDIQMSRTDSSMSTDSGYRENDNSARCNESFKVNIKNIYVVTNNLDDNEDTSLIDNNKQDPENPVLPNKTLENSKPANGAGEKLVPYHFDGYRGHCYCCSIDLTSIQHANQHLYGQKHQKKLSQWKLAQAMKTQQLDTDQAPSQVTDSQGLPNNKNEAYYFSGSRGFCHVCNIELTSLQHMQQHVFGKPHKRSHERFLLSKKGATYPLTCDLCNKSFSGQESAQQHFTSSKHKSKADVMSNAVPVLMKIDDGRIILKDGQRWYFCDICQVPLNTLEQFQIHKSSPRHNKECESRRRDETSVKEVISQSSSTNEEYIEPPENYTHSGDEVIRDAYPKSEYKQTNRYHETQSGRDESVTRVMLDDYQKYLVIGQTPIVNRDLATFAGIGQQPGLRLSPDLAIQKQSATNFTNDYNQNQLATSYITGYKQSQSATGFTTSYNRASPGRPILGAGANIAIEHSRASLDDCVIGNDHVQRKNDGSPFSANYFGVQLYPSRMQRGVNSSQMYADVWKNMKVGSTSSGENGWPTPSHGQSGTGGEGNGWQTDLHFKNGTDDGSNDENGWLNDLCLKSGTGDGSNEGNGWQTNSHGQSRTGDGSGDGNRLMTYSRDQIRTGNGSNEGNGWRTDSRGQSGPGDVSDEENGWLTSSHGQSRTGVGSNEGNEQCTDSHDQITNSGVSRESLSLGHDRENFTDRPSQLSRPVSSPGPESRESRSMSEDRDEDEDVSFSASRESNAVTGLMVTKPRQIQSRQRGSRGAEKGRRDVLSMNGKADDLEDFVTHHMEEDRENFNIVENEPVHKVPTQTSSPPVEPVRSDKPGFRYRCKVCDKYVNTREQYENHVKGKNHLYNLSNQPAQERNLECIQKVNMNVNDIVMRACNMVNKSLNIAPRPYQLELVQKAMVDNCIIYLPTGTGKTLVAILTMGLMLQDNPSRPVLFLVDKVLLVMQQARYIMSHFDGIQFTRQDDPKSRELVKRQLNIKPICGGLTTKTDMPIWKHDIVVTTAAYCINMLQNGLIRWEDFSLVVLDEAHHCNKGHPYLKLISKYHCELPDASRAKLLGLTASPAGKATVEMTYVMLKNLLSNLGGAKITLVEKEQDSLNRVQSMAKDLPIYVPMSTKEEDFKRRLLEYFILCYTQLAQMTNSLDNSSPPCSFFLEALKNPGNREVATQLADNFSRDPEPLTDILNVIYTATCKPGLSPEQSHCFDSLRMHILELLLIVPEVGSSTDTGGLVKTLSSSVVQEFSKMGLPCETMLQRVKNFEEDGNKDQSMFSKLVQVLQDPDFINWNDPKSRALVLVRERKLARQFSNRLKAHHTVQNRGLHVGHLVGHGSGAKDGGMDVKKQRKVFDNHEKYHILVGTSIMEEGIDIQALELVVCMNPPTSVRALVQMRGRARKEGSHFVVLCSSQEDVDKLKNLQRQEQNMQEAARRCLEESKK